MAKGFSNKAAIYVRVSTSEQALEGISIDAQIAKLTRYSREANLEVVAIIKDEAISASKHLATRPGGSRLLEMVQKKEVTHVIGLKLDRLFRNAGDALSTIERWDNAGVSTHLIDFMNGSILDTRSPMGKMLLGICATFAQFERDLISQRTSDALQYKKKSRQAYCRGVFGFVRKGKELVEDTAQLATVKLIKELRAAGKSLRAIAAHLNDLGIAPQRNGAKWVHTSVQSILSNDIYNELESSAA